MSGRRGQGLGIALVPVCGVPGRDDVIDLVDDQLQPPRLLQAARCEQIPDPVAVDDVVAVRVDVTDRPEQERVDWPLPGVNVRFGCELISFTQDANSVTAVVQPDSAAEETIRASYLVGCDGGSSTVRKQLAIPLQGEGNIRKLRQALFRCDDLYERIPMGKGRHYHIAEGPLFPFIILQDSTQHWTLHEAASSDAEMAEIFKKALAMPIEFEMLSVNEWTQHLLCAERYGEGRIFVAGDAAHLVIPTGGLGMNTGVGDAVDLSWKLAATLAGWGGPQLLASYEAERRPIGLRNVKASRTAMTGRLGWRAAYHPNVRDNTPEGAATRARMSRLRWVVSIIQIIA